MKHFPYLLTFVFALGLIFAACGGEPQITPVPSVAQFPTATPVATATPQPVATPAPTATPAPSVTPAPTTTPQPTVTPAPSPRVGEWSRTYSYLVNFLAHYSPRESGTDEEKAAGDHLIEQMEGLGYEVSFEEFDFESQDISTLEIEGEARDVFMLDNSQMGTQTGHLVYVGLGSEEEMPEEGLTGKIALIKRGELYFQDKGANAAAAGAIAAIIFNNEPRLFGGYAEGLDIPVLTLSGEDGEALLARLEAGEELSAELTAEADIRSSRNIVAHKESTGDDAKTLILGAHYDTLPGVVGANDNAAGVSVLRMVAEHVSEMDDLPFHVKVLFLGAGEAYLAGADEYADGMSEEELENTIGMVNFDVLGTGFGQLIIGSPELTEIANHAGQDLGIKYTVIPLEEEHFWSNHTEFSEVGLPVLTFSGDNFQQTSEGGIDDLKWINPGYLDRVERTAVEFIRRLAEE